MREIVEFKSVTQALDAMGLEKPMHPLISIFKHKDIQSGSQFAGKNIVSSFYIIEFKDNHAGSFNYGRTKYDFEEGTLIFLAPGQVLQVDNWDEDEETNGWTLLFHPELIRSSSLGERIRGFSFFSYEVNEALHISDKEKGVIEDILNKISWEYGHVMDDQSHKLILTNLELLLEYCIRYYNRQFITRTQLNSDIITRFEALVQEYLDTNLALEKGVLSVKHCGRELNISPNYLSDLMKKETGKTAQEHIHIAILERAKNRLLNSASSISQIAYDLGFEYPQNFSKIFKKKIGISPREFRSLNQKNR